MSKRKHPARVVFADLPACSGVSDGDKAARLRLSHWVNPAMAPYLRPPRIARAYFTGGSSSLALARNCPCGKHGCGLAGLEPMEPYAGGAVDSRFVHTVAVRRA